MSRGGDPPPYRTSVGRRPSPLARNSEGYRTRIPPPRPDILPRQPSRYIRQGHHVLYVDGLGDRDRSLTPDDSAWDTLQSTMTPDPQPPSVGSSFASTTASAAISRNTSANTSANTSFNTMTNPDEETEPPCDHEFDESEDGEGAELRRTESRRPTPHGRRSYADVAADPMLDPTSRDEGNDRPEWLSGMHRIVRGLASRQDIPDEWWAEAGLSRSMRYEDSIQAAGVIGDMDIAS